MQLTFVGDCAFLVEYREADLLEANHRVLALHHVLAAHPVPGLLDLIPAYRTLLIVYDPLVLLPDKAAAWVHSAESNNSSAPAVSGRVIEVPVRYGGGNGPDLVDVARHSGLSETEVIQRHTAVNYTVMFIGFMPGFPYLHGLDRVLATPRLATPRRQVPAGSIGIGGDQTGVYPTTSPGGWRLIGRTPLTLYDPRRDPPTFLRAGDTIRFVAV